MAPTADPSRGEAAPDPSAGAASAVVDPNLPASIPTSINGRSSPVMTGQRWHAYQIGDPIDGGPGWGYFAVNVGMLDDVIIRIFPIDERTATRAKAWELIQQAKQPTLLESFSVHEEGGFRYEVSRVPPATTLKEWSACRKAGFRDVELIVRQLSAALGQLHDRGVVHLNIKPSTIFVGADETEMQIVLGGLEYATLFEQKQLIPIEVDPFYAPPEAAGLSKHSPGATLRMWDWWCLGRVIQEIVLGRHILGELLGRDVSIFTPELRAKAEALLLEREHGLPKAGAVERMQGLDTDVAKLLRGLLASSRDGRWGFNEVQRWLTREPVLDRYQLGRNDRLFQWKNRSFSVPETAEFFAKEENWKDGVANLYNLQDPLTFVHFLGEAPSYKQTREKLDEIRRFSELPAWQTLSQDVVKSTVAAATWCLLKGAKAQLMLKGRRIEVGYLRLLASATGPADGREFLRAMTALPFIQLIEKADAEAARLLAELAGTVAEVFSQAEKHGWLVGADEEGHAHLIALVLEPDTTLRTARERLIQQYAVARDPALAPLFANAHPSRSQLALLAFAEEKPRQFGFITHLEWNEQQHAELRKKGTRLAAAIFWLRLDRLLWVGSLVFGHWIRVLVTWGLVGGLLWKIGPAFFHSPMAAIPLAVAAGLRVLGFFTQRAAAQHYAPDSKPWIWKSTRADCREEARLFAEMDTLPTLGVLSGRLAKINADMAALHLPVKPAPVRVPHAFSSWVVVVAAWLSFFVLAIGGGSYRLYRSDEYSVLVTIRHFLLPDVSSRIDVSPPLKADLPTPEELFFADPHFGLQTWSYREPMEAPALPVEHFLAASPDQVAVALIEAQRVLRPYPRKSVNALIAVSVPLAHDSGLMIYDARKRALAAHRIYILRDLPNEPTWFSMGDRKVLFLRDDQ